MTVKVSSHGLWTISLLGLDDALPQGAVQHQGVAGGKAIKHLSTQVSKPGVEGGVGGKEVGDQ